MKHVKAMTHASPAKANAFQEILCEIAHFVLGVSTAIGGTLPIIGFVDTKCDLPQPGGSTNTGA